MGSCLSPPRESTKQCPQRGPRRSAPARGWAENSRGSPFLKRMVPSQDLLRFTAFKSVILSCTSRFWPSLAGPVQELVPRHQRRAVDACEDYSLKASGFSNASLRTRRLVARKKLFKACLTLLLQRFSIKGVCFFSTTDHSCVVLLRAK